VPARDADGNDRDGAEVAELVGFNLDTWPPGTRAIVRRERPHPGAQLTFSDIDGHRFQAFITDQDDTDLAALELRHRGHARVEDKIRAAKATGLRNLPFGGYVANEAWLQLILIALDLTAWTQRLCLVGTLVAAEPKKLRYRSGTPPPGSLPAAGRPPSGSTGTGPGQQRWPPPSNDYGQSCPPEPGTTHNQPTP